MLALVHDLDAKLRPLPSGVGTVGRRPLVVLQSSALATLLDDIVAEDLSVRLRPRNMTVRATGRLGTAAAEAIALGTWPLVLVGSAAEQEAVSRSILSTYPLRSVRAGPALSQPCWLEAVQTDSIRQIAGMLSRAQVAGMTVRVEAPSVAFAPWLCRAVAPAIAWRAHLRLV